MMGKGFVVTLVLTTLFTVSIGQSEHSTKVDIHPQPGPANNSSTTSPSPLTSPTTTRAPNTTTVPTSTTTPAPNTTTVPTSTTTLAPKTTTVPTSTTTPAPNTTTVPTSTTTPAPNTTTVPTSTTTPAPNTTTAPTPTTTVAPPVPQPEVGKWMVQNKTANITCIMADMAVQLNVTHKDSQNKPFMLVDVPKNATASGSCAPNEQVLVLTWPAVANKTNELNMTFTKNDTAKEFSVSFSVVLEIPDGKNVTEMKLKSAKPEFNTPYEMSYHCAKAQKVNLTTEESNATAAYVTVSNAQIEAFHSKPDGTFSAAKDCELSGSPDIVPIAVGCALVGLVAIVLIAYLIGRRRSQARGYLSMPKVESTEDMIQLQNISSWRRCWH